MCCIVTKCRLLAQVSREKIFFSICENFLDFGKILGLYTILDFHEICLRIYEFKQDLKFFSRFDNFSKAIFLKKTLRFGIFFRICKIFLDCPFSTSVPKYLSYLSFFDYSYIIILP